MIQDRTNTIVRYALVCALIIVGFAMVLGKIFKTQTAERNKWLALTANQVQNESVVQPHRGNILDAEGRLLVSSIPEYYVYMDTRVEALHLGGDTLFTRYIDSIATGLSQIVGDASARQYKSKITQSFYSHGGRGSYIRLCTQRVTYMQKRDIENLPLICRGVYKSGVSFKHAPQRKKPFGSLSSRTLGTIRGENGVGNTGIEKSFDQYLHGKEGRASRQKIAGHWEYVPIVETEDGLDVQTTLDANLMDITESALRSKLEACQADWGCCILMETRTGKIKAISNLDRTAEGSYVERANHAVQRVEPGSTFKTIAMMAAMDDGRVSISDTFQVYRNGWKYGDATHYDAHPKDTVYDMKSALAVSSNIAFAKMIVGAYEGKAARFVNKLEKMGLRDSVYSEIPGAQNPRIDVPNDGVTLSRMAYGYSVEMTPLQILTFYNGIANDGKMIRPYIVSAVLNHGKAVETYDTETLKGSMCSASVLRDVKSALHDVVWDNHLGTASVLPWGTPKAQSKIVQIAGKTGTAQLLVNGRYQNRQHRMTFVGYFPEENPIYTCICMIQHPHNYGAYDAGMDCGGVVKRIAERTIVYTGHYVIKNGQLIYETN